MKDQNAQKPPAISQVHISLPDLEYGGIEEMVFS
jgi:hypothetical protein